jgi:AbrB family looped-hinge helix DNA binding protein
MNPSMAKLGSTSADVIHIRRCYPRVFMSKLVPVSQKGQVVIPAALRKKHKIGRTVVIAEADGKITIEPSMSMEESFGADGDAMLEVAREISMERRREVESERR